MDGRTHSKIFWRYFFIPFVVLLVLMKMYWFIPLLILSNLICDPDEDTKIMGGKTHRSFLTHSIIIAVVIILSFGVTIMDTFGLLWSDILLWLFKGFMVLTLPVLVHLILDIPVSRHKVKGVVKKGNRVGKYCISLYPFDGRLSAFWSVTFLLVNILSIISVWVVYYIYIL